MTIALGGARRRSCGDLHRRHRHRDSGRAISRKLGRPFEQVENQFTKTKGGSGLGLAISKSLVELHGGALVDRQRVGKGTTVTVLLPHLTTEPATAAS